jgi:hypothetical protein
MNLFAVLHRIDGSPVPKEVRCQLAGASCCRDNDALRWLDLGSVAILVSDDPVVGPRPTIVQHGQWLGVGMVRLDHPTEVAAMAGVATDHSRSLSHMELVLRAFVRLGQPSVDRFIGDFAFVLVNVIAGYTFAARDPFGVRALFCAEGTDLIAFASRAELLATPERYDVEFIAEFLSGARPGRRSTAYSGVHPVAPGSCVSIVDGRRSIRTFWEPSAFAMHPITHADPSEKVAEFRDLLTRAVRLRMTGEANC